jgi:hypothetical protein
MKKFLFSFVALFLVYASSNIFAQDNTDQERNKEIAVKYHELNPDDIDAILTVDFIGLTNENTWNRENHRQAWTNNTAEDKIVLIVAENDLVAIKFIRMGEVEGKSFSVDAMQFMRFKNGKIAEIWEVYDPNQYESQVE